MPIVPYTPLPPELKSAAEKILDREGVTMAAYIRLALVHLVEAGDIPFPNKHATFVRLGRRRKVTTQAA